MSAFGRQVAACDRRYYGFTALSHLLTLLKAVNPRREPQPAGGMGLQHATNKDQALASRLGGRMTELTAMALNDADVLITLATADLQFGFEEACQRANADNWPQRLVGKSPTHG